MYAENATHVGCVVLDFILAARPGRKPDMVKTLEACDVLSSYKRRSFTGEYVGTGTVLTGAWIRGPDKARMRGVVWSSPIKDDALVAGPTRG